MTPTALSDLDVPPARRVSGTLRVPGDKSLSHRYVLFGAMARGTTTVHGLAPGADVASSVACMRGLGASIEPVGPHSITVRSAGQAAWSSPTTPLDAGNSGTTMRLLAGLLAGCPFRSVLTGDESLSRRPMRRITEPLRAMGARIDAVDDRAPLTIHGGSLSPIDWVSPVASAQVKSAILLAGLSAAGDTSVTEPLRSRDHTERAFPAFGLEISVDGLTCRVRGGQRATAPAAPLTVPGDPSSAAVWAAAAAALPGSTVRIEGVCLNPLRLGFVDVLRRSGADVDLSIDEEIGGEPVGSIEVTSRDHGATTVGPDEVPSLIDELPVLAARAALGGRLEVSGAGELRVKESDRITALVTGFRALGVAAEERPDGFVIDGRQRPSGGTADAVGDHRLVLAFTIVGLGAAGPTRVLGAHAVGVSYPGFAEDLHTLVG